MFPCQGCARGHHVFHLSNVCTTCTVSNCKSRVFYLKQHPNCKNFGFYAMQCHLCTKFCVGQTTNRFCTRWTGHSSAWNAAALTLEIIKPYTHIFMKVIIPFPRIIQKFMTVVKIYSNNNLIYKSRFL